MDNLPPEVPSPAALIDLATAYQHSRVLAALIELGIPTLLSQRPRSPEEVAAHLKADPLAIGLLLEAVVALGVLERRSAGFANTAAAARFLTREAPDYLGDVLLRHDRMARSQPWAEFSQRLCAWRVGSPSLAKEATPTSDDRDGQHQLALLGGAALGRAFDLSPFHRLLDLGGGTGGLSIALCRAHPHLSAAIVELPAIASPALERVRSAGLEARIAVQPGDFLSDSPWPGGGDVVLLVNVLSMLSAETSRELLVRIFTYLPAGGAVILSGWMPRPGEHAPLGPLLLGLEDIALGAADVERPAAQYAAWLAHAGFSDLEQVEYFLPATLVAGRKPSSRP